MKTRVTQTEIARVAGVHNTTVSLALRNSHLIPVATRDRIQAIAQTMGYCPDPALSALVAYRDSRRQKRTLETLAYLTNWETKWGWRSLPAHEMHYLAARRKAAALGYQLEHLWLGEPGMNPRRLDRMLLHRGISGVLFAASRASGQELTELNWSRLSAVRIGGYPHAPALNQITVDPVAIVRQAMRHVLFAGYRRIGLVMSHRWDKLTDQVWSAAFHAEQYRCHLREMLPILRLQCPLEEQPLAEASPHDVANDAAALLRWHRQYRPEVIIGTAPALLEHIRRCGFLVPDDMAYADLLLHEAGHQTAGVGVDCEKLGELAVEMLATQLRQNDFGVPSVATVTSVGGTWRDGYTLPVRRPAVVEHGAAAAGHPVAG
jgi:LacI family transcriptional regulator